MGTTEHHRIVRTAIYEDLADIGDITTDAVIDPEDEAIAEMVTRSSGVVAGLSVAGYVFEVIDPAVEFVSLSSDGDRVGSDTVIARVTGRARSILTAERTALNLLGRMSGVATATSLLVEAVKGTRARISDTRKTMPGLRSLDKAAVRAGGGVSHRMGLYDAVMIKDNHIVAAGDIATAVRKARDSVGPDVPVEVEVEDLTQLEAVLGTSADRVLLDNMDLETLGKAVARAGDAIVTEASGGVTLETVRAIAETGVDIISVGWITHSAPQLDIGLDFLS